MDNSEVRPKLTNSVYIYSKFYADSRTYDLHQACFRCLNVYTGSFEKHR